MMVMLYFLGFNAKEHAFCNNTAASQNLLIAFEAEQCCAETRPEREPGYFSTANNNNSTSNKNNNHHNNRCYILW